MSPLVLFPLIGGDPAIRPDDPEPSIAELLDDPVLKLMMQGDRVRPTELRRIMDIAGARLRGARRGGHTLRPVSVFDCAAC